LVSPPRDRPIAYSPFFFARRRCADARARWWLDHHVFVVVVAGQLLEDALENATLRPSTKALVRGKNDAADAEALCEAMGRPTMRFVPDSRATGGRR
jgi:hypothetical protein